jgi:hypothetical protein
LRFALHIEVKYPGDRFKKAGRQAEAYPIRAQCWIAKTPKYVLPHARATTALLFSEQNRLKFAPHLKHFDTLITLEDVEKNFPNATATLTS